MALVTKMRTVTFDESKKGQALDNVVGLISIKDIFEDIMQEELVDEDKHGLKQARDERSTLGREKLELGGPKQDFESIKESLMD